MILTEQKRWSCNHFPRCGKHIWEILISIQARAQCFLFIVAKTWKQPKCPLTEEWIKKMWCIYTMGYYSTIKQEWNNAICSNMIGPRECHIEWSKSDRGGEISYDIPFMWNLKRNYTNKITKQRLTDLENELLVVRGYGKG